MFNEDRVLKCFNIKKGDIISVTGGGGKTSLIFLLSKILSKHGRVLVTTTTKIYTPNINEYENLYLNKLNKKFIGKNKGIDILGSSFDESKEKLIGVSDEGILEIKEKYDYILIEADGSSRKSMKAWNEKDPVIPKFTTKIIGVTNLNVLGKKVCEGVHREKLFTFQHRVNSEDILTLELMIRYLRKGKFFKIKDKISRDNNIDNIEKYIFINGVEGVDRFNDALFLGNNLSYKFQKRGIKIAMGSIYKNEVYQYRKIDAIGLLSGFSSRMGEDKLLIQYRGKTLMEHLLHKLDEVSFYKKTLVSTEERFDIFRDKISKEYIKTVNKEAHLGQSQSIKLGVSAIEESLDGYMFFTGDQPFLRKETILKLLMEFFKNPQVVLPYYKERSFSPVIFPTSYKERLLDLGGDKGGKSMLKSCDKICKVYFENEMDFIDIDCKKDLEHLKY